MSSGLKYAALAGFILAVAIVFPRTGQAQQNKQQFYVCMENLSPGSVTYLKNNNIPLIKIIYQNFIDPDQDSKLNEDVFEKRIQALFPNASDGGMGIIDWEARGMEKLPVDDPAFKQLVSEYRKVVQTAKQLRPNVKWSFYGLPIRKYMSYNAEWRNRAMSAIPILKDCDFIAPSLYDFFPDSLKEKDNQDYYEKNVSMALEIGSRLNKPVYPFVWNRWHDSNKQMGLQLIPVGEFKKHVKQIASVTYNGKKIDGVIWWGADQFFYSHKARAVVAEQARFSNFNAYQDNTINVYAKALQDIFGQR